MSPNITPILFGFLLYLIYVLIPLIPSILIYKIFPDSKVGANGFLGNLKINATGAFAAYIIVVILGYFIVRQIQDLIAFSYGENSSWVVNSKVTFMTLDSNGEWIKSSKVSDKDVRERLDIKTNPDYNEKNLSSVSFMTYARNGFPKLTFSYPDHEPQVIDLTGNNVKIDLSKKTIDLGNIEMKEINQSFNPSAFDQIKPTDTPEEIITFGSPKTQKEPSNE